MVTKYEGREFENIGTQIDTIDVKLNYRIIDLFSDTLYSSPNKAFEELVSNSYDAFATTVAVHVPFKFSSPEDIIWVWDNGEGMDQTELKELWNIGKSLKRTNKERDKKRLQIGKFGIGKLATYVLCHKLTYVTKKNNRYLITTMDYSNLEKKKETDDWKLSEREITEKEAESLLNDLTHSSGNYLLPEEIFGKNSNNQWTFAILSDLKSTVERITPGALTWVLTSALPLNPSFVLYLNGQKLESTKIKIPLEKKWIIGNNDKTASVMHATTNHDAGSDQYSIDFDEIKGVKGYVELYRDSLVSGVSSKYGRSHGIFLIIRGRLINLDDSLLGLSPFFHGVFNRTRIYVEADGLDEVLTSTRESLMESAALNTIKLYIKGKFNNEVRAYYDKKEAEDYKENSISHRLRGSMTLSKEPLLRVVQKLESKRIVNPLLIEKLENADYKSLTKKMEEELSEVESVIKDVDFVALGSGEPIAKLDLVTGLLKINLMHPFVANHAFTRGPKMALQFISVTEVLTEAHLYELDIDEMLINDIMRKRDLTLRQLALSDRRSIPVVASLLLDSLSYPREMEEAVYQWFIALGFSASKIGGSNEPDGRAEAILGYYDKQNLNYSVVYDAKSTFQNRIPANQAHSGSMTRFKEKHKADFAVVVAKDYEGANDPNSAISIEATQQGFTALTAEHLYKILFLWAPHQLGLSKIRTLFEKAHTPLEVSEWIKNIEEEETKEEPFEEVLEAIFFLQGNDKETPDISSVRARLIEQNVIDRSFLKEDLEKWITSLKIMVPEFITFEGARVGLESSPEKIKEAIESIINKVPSDWQDKYNKVFFKK